MRIKVLSRLPPNRNIVRFFAEYREHIPLDVYAHLPPVAQVWARVPIQGKGVRGANGA